jgi:hypothetical protein
LLVRGKKKNSNNNIDNCVSVEMAVDVVSHWVEGEVGWRLRWCVECEKEVGCVCGQGVSDRYLPDGARDACVCARGGGVGAREAGSAGRRESRRTRRTRLGRVSGVGGGGRETDRNLVRYFGLIRKDWQPPPPFVLTFPAAQFVQAVAPAAAANFPVRSKQGKRGEQEE